MGNKEKFLKGLAHISHPKSSEIVEDQVSIIEKAIFGTTNYIDIEENISLLSDIAVGVPEKSVPVFISILEYVADIEFTYPNTDGVPEEHYAKYHTRESIIGKVLEALERIRYHQVEVILEVFLKYSTHNDKNVREKALHGLKELSEYDIFIVYGSKDKSWPGLRVEPQLTIINKLESLSDDECIKYFEAVISLCSNMLSPTMSTTSSDYQTLTWETGAVPAAGDIPALRKRVLTFLENLYQNDLIISKKLSVISAMHSATRVHRGNHSDKSYKMILENTERLLSFFEEIIKGEKFQIIQRIEHDVFWTWYHKNNAESIVEQCLKIKEVIDANTEYSIYRSLAYRSLAGFDDLEHSWQDEKKKMDAEDFKEQRNKRDEKVKKLAESVTESNFDEWERRIIGYITTESDSSCPFMYMNNFLCHFSEVSPELGLRMLNNNMVVLDKFLFFIMLGLFKSNEEGAYKLINEWIDSGKHLTKIARLLGVNFNIEYIKKLLNKATSVNDNEAMAQILSSVAANYEDSGDKESVIDELFIPTLEILTKNKDSRWVFDFWHRGKQSSLISDSGDKGADLILNNLLTLDRIDYQAEEVLTFVAKKDPEKVIEFFGKRLVLEYESGDKMSSHDAVPFSFHHLHEELSGNPESVVKIVRGWYDGNCGLSKYKGPRLLKLIFFNFPDSFQKELLKLINTGNEADLTFVIAVLRNYEGEKFLHKFCKELVKAMPDNDRFNADVSIILQRTGVLAGEYGFANAYKKKISEIEDWLDDENEKVRKFAEKYKESLQGAVERETKRATEEIELRKYKYGDSSSTSKKQTSV